MLENFVGLGCNKQNTGGKREGLLLNELQSFLILFNGHLFHTTVLTY
jgi:hypothetical protein